MRRLTAYFVVPIWMAAAFADYVWHRRTRIETTSGIKESLMHTLMMVEAGPAVLAPLFVEVNAGVLAVIIGLSILHELTVWWDLAFTTPRRLIPAGEQVIHTFLEAPPFIVSAAAIATHWQQFLALLGRGGDAPRFAIRIQKPPLGGSSLTLLSSALLLLGAVPHVDELRRCYLAQREARIGQDTPPALAEVFSQSREPAGRQNAGPAG